MKKFLEKWRKKVNHLGTWELDTLSDEFGDNTDKRYIKNKGLGTFSNTATDNSKLIVEMHFEKNNEDPRFRFYEYGKYIVKYRSKPIVLKCKCKIKDRGVFEFELQNFVIGETFHIYAHEAVKQCIFSAIEEEREMKFYCYEVDSPVTIYKFSFDNRYFKKAVRWLDYK